MELFKYPKNLGQHLSKDVVLAQGKFGPYIKFDGINVSIPGGFSLESIDLSKAIDLIELKKKSDAPIHTYEEFPITKGKGRFGPFIKWNGIFINVNKKYDFDNLSIADIEQLIEDKKQKEKDKIIHNWEKDGILVVNGASVAASGEDQINFVASAESVGDFIDIWSDGNKWYVWGIGNASGSITATDPS